MRQGRYFQIGKYHLWFGYQGKDTNLLRIDGIEPIKNYRLRPEGLTVTGTANNQILQAQLSRFHRIKIEETCDNNLHFSKITSYWLAIPLFWIAGQEKAHKGTSLIETICHLNKLRPEPETSHST